MAWAVLAGVLFAVMAFLTSQDRAPLDSFDVEGRALEDWADDSGALVDVLRVIEVGFGTIGMAILTVVLAGALFLRRQRWAALVAVVVMTVTSLATTGLKRWLGRDRPDWQDTFEDGSVTVPQALRPYLGGLDVMKTIG